MEIEHILLANDIEEIYSFEVENEDNKRLIYRLDKKNLIIKFYPQDFCVNEITLKGFKTIPEQFSENGYIKQGLLYYINKKVEGLNPKSFTIDKIEKSSIKISSKKAQIIFNYSDLEYFKNKMTDISNESKRDRSLLADEFFYTAFPSHFPVAILSSQKRLNKLISNLDKDVIERIGPFELQKFEEFYEELIKTKYKSDSHKLQLITRTKVKIDTITVDAIISEFEDKLSKETSESLWGKFLGKNLFLIDSKYVKSIPELNLVMAGARKVDFGLIDSQDYLDMFEIKKPTTKLLSPEQDRGNHFWHSEAVKALTQAEKYLYYAESRRKLLEEDIEKQKKHKVSVIKPRAYVIMGNSAQLDTQEKREDFRVLRLSLKNVEVILYDELLERLKNQKKKVFE